MASKHFWLFFYIVIFTAVCIAIYMIRIKPISFFDTFSSLSTRGLKYFPPNSTIELQRHFRLHWYRERKARADWWGILKPCFHNTDWGQIRPGWEKEQRSDAFKSYLIYQDIRPAREYSRIFIQTKTKDGRLKSFGGDMWRVFLIGPASIAGTIFDHNNGTYEALFLIMDAGIYRIEAHLDYSLCDGVKNPPKDWFIKGNMHGKKQKEGSLGFLDEYLCQQIPGNLSITIRQPRHHFDIQTLVPDSQCDEYCTFLSDGYGRWTNGTWAPFLKTPHNTNETLIKTPSGTIVSYGDSLGLRFGNSMSRNSNIRQVYNSATYKYNWIYPVSSEKLDQLKDDDLDFDSDRVVSYIKQTLEQPSINIQESTLVLNMGLHYTITVNFTTYQNLLEKVLDLFFVNQTLESQTDPKPRYKANLVWKTITQIKKENGEWLNRTESRFYTTHRVLLFNAYATWRMCRAGVPVLDVLQVTQSFPSGPLDVHHYADHVFRHAEDTLADFKRFYNNKKYKLERSCIS